MLREVCERLYEPGQLVIIQRGSQRVFVNMKTHSRKGGHTKRFLKNVNTIKTFSRGGGNNRRRLHLQSRVCKLHTNQVIFSDFFLPKRQIIEFQ